MVRENIVPTTVHDGMEWLLAEQKLFKESVLVAIDKSQSAAGRFVHPRLTFGTMLFARVKSIAMSMDRLGGPHLVKSKLGIGPDFGTIASLARDLIDAVVMMFYVTDPVDDEVWQMRKWILDLHDCTARIQLFEALEQRDSVVAFTSARKEIVQKLIASLAFQSLSKEFRNKLIKGERVMVVTKESVLDQMGVHQKHFTAMNKLISAQVHTTPLGWYRMHENGRGAGKGTEAEIGYCALAFEYGRGYLEKASERMILLFPDIGTPPTEAAAPQPHQL